MEAKELRIGNYFYDRNEKVLRLDWWEYIHYLASDMTIDGVKVHPMTEHVQKAKPIPLTEEWHNKFGVKINGFKIFEYTLPRKNNLDIKVIFNGDYVMLRQGKGDRNDDILSIWNKDLTNRDMFVHEWQNLYFALTNEELKLK